MGTLSKTDIILQKLHTTISMIYISILYLFSWSVSQEMVMTGSDIIKILKNKNLIPQKFWMIQAPV